jgi:hypothetical protein
VSTYPATMSKRFAKASAVGVAAVLVVAGLAAVGFTRGNINEAHPSSHPHRRRLRRLVQKSPSPLYDENVPAALRGLEVVSAEDEGFLPTSAPVIVEHWPAATGAPQEVLAAPLAATQTPLAAEESTNLVHTESNTATANHAITVSAVLVGFIALLVVGVYLVKLHLSTHRTAQRSNKTDAGDTEDPSDTDFPSIIDVGQQSSHDDDDLMLTEHRDYPLKDKSSNATESRRRYDASSTLPTTSEHSTYSNTTRSEQPLPVPLPRLKCPKLDRVSPKLTHKSSPSRHGRHTRTVTFDLSSGNGETESAIVRQMKQAAAALNGETTIVEV